MESHRQDILVRSIDCCDNPSLLRCNVSAASLFGTEYKDKIDEFNTEFRKARDVFDRTISAGTFQMTVNIGEILREEKTRMLMSPRQTFAA